MARLAGLFQNRCIVTGLVFAALALLVGVKTMQTVPSLITNSIDAASIELAQKVVERTQNAKRIDHAQLPTPSPGFALVLATFAIFDPLLKKELRCIESDVSCTPRAFRTVFIAQYVLALLSLIAIFVTAWTLSRAWSVALLTLLFAFIAGSYGAYAGTLMPLIWPQSITLIGLMCLALGSTHDDIRWTFAAGGAFGLAALFIQQLFIAALITTVSFWLLSKIRHFTLTHPLAHLLSFVVGLISASIILVGTPWSEDLTNALSHNSTAHLAERIPMTMSGVDWTTYLTETPGIFFRGLWVGTPILTVLGLVHLPSLLKFSREDARLGPTLLVATPILSLFVINTLVTANHPEFNVGLVFLLTYATAYLVGRTEVRRKFWEDKKRAENLAPSN